MNGTHAASPKRLTPLKGFVSVFAAVFLVVWGGSAVLTFLLPPTYVGVARVRLAPSAQVSFYESEPVLRAAIEKLDLNLTFAASFGETKPLPVERTLQILRRTVQVRQPGAEPLGEIRAYSREPEQAAQLANAIARAGVEQARAQGSSMPQVVDLAIPAQKPVRPNKPLNLTLGALVGAFLGIMAGGVGARLAVGRDKSPDQGALS